MSVIDLGDWTTHPDLCGHNLERAAGEAHRLGYAAAMLTIAGTSRRVRVLVLAEPAGSPGQPEHFVLWPAMPERLSRLGTHPADSARPHHPIAPVLPH